MNGPKRCITLNLDANKRKVASMFLAYFPKAIEKVTKVSEYGAEKYTKDGWRSVDNGIERYTDALVRHLMADICGEVSDPDTQDQITACFASGVECARATGTTAPGAVYVHLHGDGPCNEQAAMSLKVPVNFAPPDPKLPRIVPMVALICALIRDSCLIILGHPWTVKHALGNFKKDALANAKRTQQLFCEEVD